MAGFVSRVCTGGTKYTVQWTVVNSVMRFTSIPILHCCMHGSLMITYNIIGMCTFTVCVTWKQNFDVEIIGIIISY